MLRSHYSKSSELEFIILICIATGAWLGSFKSVGIERLNSFKLLSVRKVIMLLLISIWVAHLLLKERFDEACDALRRGVALDDSCNDAKFNLGLTLLTIGEFEEGWHFYDTRLRLPDKVRSPINSPMWDGDIESLGDHPFLVWAEQGFGDNIQFVRYVQILIEAGVKVTLSTRKPLMRLFKECLQPHAPAIVEHKSENFRAFKHHVALLSLPRLCGTNKETVPMMPGFFTSSSSNS